MKLIEIPPTETIENLQLRKDKLERMGFVVDDMITVGNNRFFVLTSIFKGFKIKEAR